MQEDWELKIYGEEPEPKSTFLFFCCVFNVQVNEQGAESRGG